MSRRSMRTVLLVLAFIVFVAVPASAWGQTRIASYQLQYTPYDEAGRAMLIVTGILPPETALPATVTIPVPTGGRLLWAGEILGGNPDDDPSRQPTFALSGGMQLITFSAEVERVVQVEVDYPAPQGAAQTMDSTITWTAIEDTTTINGSVRLEANVSDVEITPRPVAPPRSNAAGETLYSLGPATLAAGQPYTIEVSYRRGAGDASTRVSGVLIGLMIALLVAVGALIAVLASQRRQHPAEDADDQTERAEGEIEWAEETGAAHADDVAPVEELERLSDDEEFLSLD